MPTLTAQPSLGGGVSTLSLVALVVGALGPVAALAALLFGPGKHLR